MPKMKTRSSVKKRFRLTAGGHVKRKKAFRSHILTKKDRKRKRKLRKRIMVHDSQEASIRLMLTA